MPKPDFLSAPASERPKLYLYLVPIAGFFPALWTVYRRTGSKRERSVARLSVLLAFLWLAGHVLLETGAQTSEIRALSLLIASSIWTSSYFLIALGLMFRVWQGKPPWLPLLSRTSDRLP